MTLFVFRSIQVHYAAVLQMTKWKVIIKVVKKALGMDGFTQNGTT